MKNNRLPLHERLVRHRMAPVGRCVAIAAAATIALAATADYAIRWNVIASGGGTAIGGLYTLDVTIGQPLTGGAANCSFALVGGFWTPQPDVSAPVADLNGDGVVDGADLGILLSMWGECDGCSGDLNCDGVVDGADLGLLLSAWGQ